MSERAGRPVPEDKIQRILNAVWWLESYRRLVLGEEASEAVDMLDRQVAFSGLQRSVFQLCRFDYAVDLSGGRDGLTRSLYVPRVTYRNEGERAIHRLTSGGQVLYSAHALGAPLPPIEQDPDIMARRLEWLGDAAWFHSGSVTVDSSSREQGRGV